MLDYILLQLKLRCTTLRNYLVVIPTSFGLSEVEVGGFNPKRR